MAAVGCLLYATPGFARPDIDSDWTRYVPVEARFYSELRQLAEIREIFRELKIWSLVRELGERDRPGATTRPWSDRTRQFLGMETDDAVSLLLSRRAALIAVDASQWQNGVVLGELEREGQLTPLLARWDARNHYEEGEVECCTLRGGLRLAVLDRVFALGPSGDPDGLWGRAVLLMAGRGPSMRQNTEFAGLKARMSRGYQGLVYARWEPGDPAAIAGCDRLMSGFDVTEQGITAEFHGLRREPSPDAAYSGFALDKLPASTLVAFGGRADFSSIFGGKYENGGIDPRSLIELFLGFFAHGEESPVNLLTQLGPHFVLAVSAEDTGPVKMPVLTAICETSRPGEQMRQLDIVIGFFTAILASFEQQATTSAPATYVQKETINGVEVHHVPLGRFLARRIGLGVLEKVQCCWAQIDGRLVVSSSTGYVGELIRAYSGKAARLKLPSPADGSDKPAETLVLRGSELAGIIESWLRYVRTQHPAAVSGGWWQNWAKTQFEKSTELGLAVQADGKGRAVVRDVQIYSPAKDLLTFNDIIVAVNGEPLDPAHPAQDLARRYRARGSSREFVLEVVRGEQSQTIRVPVTPADALDVSRFDPITDLQRLQTLLARVRVLTLTRHASRPERLDATLRLEWQK